MFGNIKTLAGGFKAILLLMVTSFTLSWAAVPPPPVNQNIGIPDSVFNNLEKQNCWYCHVPARLSPSELTNLGWTFEAPIMKDGVITDRHHARLGMIIGDNTQAPNGVPGQAYECLSCHSLEFDPNIGANVFTNSIDSCLNCHTQTGGASVHHTTAPAQALDCKHCHGSRVDNPGDGHYIPIGRAPTSVTPRTSNGKGPNGEGACTFCHSPGSESGVQIYSNSINHHSTGIGQPGVSALDCTVCHENIGSDTAIRRCESCHGINSIHNIQADSNGDGVLMVGGEDPYFGHIGNSPTDCNGCHGGYLASSVAAPFAGPVIPELTNMSTFSVTAGSATTITVTGLALTNEVATPDGPALLTSRITLTDLDGTVTELTPDVISQTSLEVTIPANQAPGSYKLRAVKITNESNPMSLTVVPSVAVNTVNAAGNVLTIDGSGFGSYVNAVGSGTNITVAGAECAVNSWTDGQIVADCSVAQCGPLVVNGIYGNATSNVTCTDAGTVRDKRRTRAKRR